MLVLIPMPWIEKGLASPFDSDPMPGRMDLIGEVMADRFGSIHTRGKKYPVIRFPSGLSRELLTPSRSEAQLHIFGALHLPRQTDRDTAYAHARKIIENYPDYRVHTWGEDSLVVGNERAKRSYKIVYDNRAQQVIDVRLGWDPQTKMDLLPGELRAALPPLYTNEPMGLQVMAPLKYFTPDANWTWYPTEFDGEDLFFGLVAGFEVELGYFTLSELEEVTGGLSLPIERDMYYTPTSLDALMKHHRGD